MSMNDPIADMLTRVRNGLKAHKDSVEVLASGLAYDTLAVLNREGYIGSVSKVEVRKGVHRLQVELKYYEGKPAICELTRISKPGRRVYYGIKDLKSIYGGLGISILSTPQGVLSDNEARRANVGGEVICSVF